MGRYDYRDGDGIMSQEEVIIFLKAHPGEWMTVKEIVISSGISNGRANLSAMFRIKNGEGCPIIRRAIREWKAFRYEYCYPNR
jgi:hypothetical protein